MEMSQVAIGDRPLAVSIAKAAELTSISKTSMKRFVREGRLITVRVGRCLIVPITSLTQMLQDGLGSSSEMQP